MSNIVEPQITETKPTKWMNDLLITNTGVVGGIDYDLSKSEKGLIKKPINPIEGGQGFLDRQNELAQQQALLQEASQMSYSG
jgi:hypothetical protein